MKKYILLTILLISTIPTFAHTFWIETAPEGALNQEHHIKIKFGEYGEGLMEKVKGDRFKLLSNFTLWIITPKGKKKSLKFIPKEDFYSASFVPSERGSYTVVIDNGDANVMDFTKSGHGLIRLRYHAKARVVVGDTVSEFKKTNPTGIDVVDLTNKNHSKSSEVMLQVLFKGESLKENELIVQVGDLWAKKITTDEDGKVSFKLPWSTKYVIEIKFKENIPGKFKGEDYDYISNRASYCISLKGK